jgi:hypothetical protein
VTKAYLASIQSALDEFERGMLDVEGLQSRLEAEAARLDNSTPELLRELEAVDSKLERIRYAVLEADQRGEAIASLQQTRLILRRSAEKL